MIAQFQRVTQPTSRIACSYTDFDGLTIDVVEMVNNGVTQVRQCWTTENLDGETVHHLKTSSGDIIQSNWRTTTNNPWLNAYVTLWYKRLDEQNNKVIDLYEQEEIELLRAAQLAKADLCFDW